MEEENEKEEGFLKKSLIYSDRQHPLLKSTKFIGVTLSGLYLVEYEAQ